MEKSLKYCWFIVAFAGIIILCNQLMYTHQLYQREKTSFMHQQNNYITNVIYEFSMKATNSGHTVSYNAINNVLTYFIDSERQRHQLHIKDDIRKIHEQTHYDIRDTNDWSLKNFYHYLQTKHDTCAIEKTYIQFLIQDSTGKIKDAYPHESIPTSLACQFSLPLGFISGDTLHATYDYPFRLFIRAETEQILLILFITLLLILCIVTLFHTLHQEKKSGEFREIFVHNIVHDLKRPIENEVKLNDLLHDHVPSQDTSLIEQSNTELNGILQSINRLLLQSTDAHGLRLNIKEIDLCQMLEQLSDHHLWNTPKNKQFNIRLQYRAQQQTIMADPNFLQPVFCNLIENALKYSGQQVDITLTCEDLNEKTIRIKFKDNGLGITPHHLGNIFKRYHRGDHLNNSKIKGHGQGLYFVRLIIRAHRGTITAESIQGQGSTFTVTLPKK